MSEGKWIWDSEILNVKSGVAYMQQTILVTDPPPNETHPDDLKKRIAELEADLEESREIPTIAWLDGRADGNAAVRAAQKLKRCEICKDKPLVSYDSICQHDGKNIPASRTCDHWKWDEHGKDD